jgi:putative DNA primase/helicase
LAAQVGNAVNKKLEELGFPDECIVGGCSGNGYHTLVRIDLPNDDDSRDLLRKCLSALQELVGTGKVDIDQTVFNAARIIKCYGTMSCKGVSTEDRPWTWSRLTIVPKQVVVCPRELLEKLAAFAPSKNPKRDLGGEKRQGPWNMDNTLEMLKWSPWKHGDQVDGGTNAIAKWLGPCINASCDHQDAALILHTDGWVSFTCFSLPDCEDTHFAEFKEWCADEKGEPYAWPGRKVDTTAWWEEGFEQVPASKIAAPNTELKSFSLTDSGNAERLLHRFGHLFLYCPEQDWLAWDGKRWVPDSKNKVHRKALRTVRSIPDELWLLSKEESQDEEGKESAQVKAILKWAKASEALTFLNAMVKEATWLGDAKNIGEFDQDQWLFNLKNGTLGLRSGAFRDHEQSDLITNVSPVSYDPKAECPLWLQFLDEVMLGDQELIAFLQRASGYSLTGSTAAHCLFLLYGTGRNGKSTFLEVLRYIIGTYCKAAPMETFMARPQEGIPNDLAGLSKARFVSAIETEESKRFNEAKIKLITGGDTISARFLRREFFDFVPQFKIWLATNNRPVIRGTDEGIWSRIKLVPFKLRLPESKRDEKLGAKLKSEASGILNWMIAGLEDYKLGGLCEPEEVSMATESYRKSEDWLQRFLDSETTAAEKENQQTQAKEVYQRYKRWAEDSKEFVQPERKFNPAMDDHGVESVFFHNKKMYKLTLKIPEPMFAGMGERVAQPEEVF